MNNLSLSIGEQAMRTVEFTALCVAVWPVWMLSSLLVWLATAGSLQPLCVTGLATSVTISDNLCNHHCIQIHSNIEKTSGDKNSSAAGIAPPFSYGTHAFYNPSLRNTPANYWANCLPLSSCPWTIIWRAVALLALYVVWLSRIVISLPCGPQVPHRR